MYAAYMAANDAAASAKNDEHAAVNSSERATATIGAFEGNASKQRESKSSESKDSENSVRASMDGPQDASASTSATLAAIATEVRDTDSADQAGGTCAAPPLPGGMAAAAATVVWHGPARTSAPGKQRN